MYRCLYDPVHGYYRRRDHNPFGSQGDFYTAVQIAPVFGEVIAAYLQPLAPSAVIDLGAGRAGLSSYLNRWNYHPVDWDLAALPDQVSGVMLANEFFDALPVRLLRREGEHWKELMVDDSGGFVVSKTLDPALVEYADRYGEVIPDGGSLEMSISLPEWMRRIANVLTSGRLLVIDYGYEARELLRFPGRDTDALPPPCCLDGCADGAGLERYHGACQFH